MIEHTLVILKPNLVGNCDVNEACRRFFDDLEIILGCELRLPLEFFKEFYGHVREPDLTRHATFCSSGPVYVLVLRGEDVIARVREILGKTDASQAALNSLRGYFYERYRPENGYDNFAHASESSYAFGRELTLVLTWFLKHRL